MNIPIDSKRPRWDRSKCAPGKDLSRGNVSMDARGVNIMQLAQAKAYEIKNLREAITTANKSEKARVFQALPRHMRRRAASHDVRRIPKRLRTLAKAQDNSETPKRKKRRKRKCLLEDYNRRKRTCKWLETHIWHAKRFRMKKAWGYKIPEKSFSKGFRAAYRATKSSCLMQDVSYMEVIEIWNKNDVFQNGLARLLPSTFLQDLSNGKMVDTVVYRSDLYPNGAIGPLKIFFTTQVKECFRQLIVIVHPAISEELLHELCNVFHCTPAETHETYNKENFIQRHQLDFCIFSLTGPASTSIINNVLRSRGQARDGNIVFNDRDKQQMFDVIVQDPRFHICKKKNNPVTKFITKEQPSVEFNPEHVTNDCSLWDHVKRKAASDSVMSDAQVNKMKEKLLNPSQDLDASKSPSIPAVLINSSVGNGVTRWHVILPSGWAMPFWIALVYEGARVGAQHEEMNLCYQNAMLSFPNNFPDTTAGESHAKDITEQNEEKHNRYPPDKRMNYDNFGVQHPFSQPWQELVSQWKRAYRCLMADKLFPSSMNTSSYYVVRDIHILKSISDCMNSNNNIDEKMCFEMMTSLENSLIPIKVSSLIRGCPEDNAMLCLPLLEDLKALENGKQDKFSTYMGPLEPAHRGIKSQFPFKFKKHDMLQHNVRYIGVNTRWLLGYIQNGGYCLAEGKGSAIGFISTSALCYVFEALRVRNVILFRNCNTLQYRFCEMQVLL